MSNRVIIKVNKDVKDKIEKHYASYQKENKCEYIDFLGKTSDVVVTTYNVEKQGLYKVMFLGDDALKEAKLFDKDAKVNEVKIKAKAPTTASWICLDDQFGSDEVGTGDFFGPICVCASYVRKSDIAYLKSLGVDDSKRLDDKDICRIAKELINKIPYSQLSLDNVKFNELVDKGMNMNEMKVKLHNQCLKNLVKKYPEVKNIFMDEFAKEETYYSYLFGEEDIVKDIVFRTKGESYYPSVAVGSIIARYSFIQKMEAMSKKYKMDVPYGASPQVTEFAKKFVKKYGKDELLKVVKKNFANLEKI